MPKKSIKFSSRCRPLSRPGSRTSAGAIIKKYSKNGKLFPKYYWTSDCKTSAKLKKNTWPKSSSKWVWPMFSFWRTRSWETKMSCTKGSSKKMTGWRIVMERTRGHKMIWLYKIWSSVTRQTVCAWWWAKSTKTSWISDHVAITSSITSHLFSYSVYLIDSLLIF